MTQRNNIARLPLESRMRIAQLIDDGASYDEIRSDAEICRLDVTLHNSSFGAYRVSDEFRDYCAARRRYGKEVERRKIGALMADGSGLVKAANFELLRLLLEKLENGDELDEKSLAALARGLAVAQKNEESKSAERESALRARIAELEEKLATLSHVDSGRVADAMLKKFGVK